MGFMIPREIVMSSKWDRKKWTYREKTWFPSFCAHLLPCASFVSCLFLHVNTEIWLIHAPFCAVSLDPYPSISPFCAFAHPVLLSASVSANLYHPSMLHSTVSLFRKSFLLAPVLFLWVRISAFRSYRAKLIFSSHFLLTSPTILWTLGGQGPCLPLLSSTLQCLAWC